MGKDEVFGAPFDEGWGQYCVFVPEELYYGFFEVTAVSRDDLKAAGFDPEGVTDETMRRLASDLGDALVTDGFWPALEIIAENLGIKRIAE